MVATLFPLQYLIATLALWLNRQQQEVIDYLKEEKGRFTLPVFRQLQLAARNPVRTSTRIKQRDQLTSVATVVLKVGIQCENTRVGVQLSDPHETGIGQRHGGILVARE